MFAVLHADPEHYHVVIDGDDGGMELACKSKGRGTATKNPPPGLRLCYNCHEAFSRGPRPERSRQTRPAPRIKTPKTRKPLAGQRELFDE